MTNDRRKSDPSTGPADPGSATLPKVKPAGDVTPTDASPSDLDAPEYYSKDRKPRVGTPDESPSTKP